MRLLKIKKYALHKHVRLLTRLYGMLFIALLLASYIHVCDAIILLYIPVLVLYVTTTLQHHGRCTVWGTACWSQADPCLAGS